MGVGALDNDRSANTRRCMVKHNALSLTASAVVMISGVVTTLGGQVAQAGKSGGVSPAYQSIPSHCHHRVGSSLGNHVYTLNHDTYVHDMSNKCIPYGPNLGRIRDGSHFRAYFRDRYEPNWCYGMSWQLNYEGWIQCYRIGL
jgi:hypothetical protein